MARKKAPKARSLVAYDMIVNGPRSTKVPDKRKQASKSACRGKVVR